MLVLPILGFSAGAQKKWRPSLKPFKLIKFGFPVEQCTTIIAVKINIMDARATVRDTENPAAWNEQVYTRKISFIPLIGLGGGSQI